VLFLCLKEVINIVTLIDIYKAIISKITVALTDTEFSTTKFSSTSIVEGITRPSLYLDFQNNKTNKFNYYIKERKLYVELFYFATIRDNAKIELLKIHDILENAFLEELQVLETFYFPVSEVKFDVNKTDGYLTCSFELYSLEEIEMLDLSEYMETLEVNAKIN
jgi:hypothetical protein